MESDELVSRRELETVKENIELKIQNAIQPLEGKIDNIQTNIDGKFETLEQKIEKMFLKQEQEIRKERQENIKWFVGTAIAIAASVAAIVSIL